MFGMIKYIFTEKKAKIMSYIKIPIEGEIKTLRVCMYGRIGPRTGPIHCSMDPPKYIY